MSFGSRPRRTLSAFVASASLLIAIVWCATRQVSHSEVAIEHLANKDTEPGHFAIILRNVSYPIVPPSSGQEKPTRKRREREVSIPLTNSALVLIDVWNVDTSHFESDEMVRQRERVVTNAIVPALKAARKSGMLVIHAPHRPLDDDGNVPAIYLPKEVVDLSRNAIEAQAGPISAQGHSESLHVDDSKNGSTWPPKDFVRRLNEFAPFNQSLFPEYLASPIVRGVHPSVKPVYGVKETGVGAKPYFYDVLKERKILHLFYAGFDTDQCVIEREVGIREASARGYDPIIIRDGTLASGSDADEIAASTESAIRIIEARYGFSTTAQGFVSAVNALPDA